ncbi:MAG TPA: uroporphyrinogen decarboxylase [Gemmatimonadales bacterium]|nr:uroporphyrinogen decarboxylase [Gemmatimonadales bacterium]
MTGIAHSRREPAFLAACRRRPTDRTPVWFMRQAGRYTPEYRAARARRNVLAICRRPKLVAQISLQPVERLGVDAAIVFADVRLPFEPLGLGLAYAEQGGLKVWHPIRRPTDVDKLKRVDPARDLAHLLEGVRQTKAGLTARFPDTPLIGSAGAPFTLASYAIEGAASGTCNATKRFMYEHPEAWHALMDKLAALLGSFLTLQAAAGADALQLFDSSVGCLGCDDYREYVLPHSKRVIELAATAGVPIIHFGTDTATLLELMAQAGGDVIGVDWRIPLDAAWARVGDRAIQGNLDPSALHAPPPELERRVQDVLRRAHGRPGHIFNLGHGIQPGTPVKSLKAVVDLVHAHR